MLDFLQRILYALVLDLILFDFRAALRCNAESSVWGEKKSPIQEPQFKLPWVYGGFVVSCSFEVFGWRFSLWSILEWVRQIFFSKILSFLQFLLCLQVVWLLHPYLVPNHNTIRSSMKPMTYSLHLWPSCLWQCVLCKFTLPVVIYMSFDQGHWINW